LDDRFICLQVFTPEFHLHTLRSFLSATAQLHPSVNIRQIVISLIDRLAAYAAREAESEDPEVTKKQEETAAKRLAEKVKSQKAKAKQNGGYQVSLLGSQLNNAWAIPTPPIVESTSTGSEKLSRSDSTSVSLEPKGKEKGKEGYSPKFRGIPEDVQLFEVFWVQVIQLIKVCFSL